MHQIKNRASKLKRKKKIPSRNRDTSTIKDLNSSFCITGRTSRQRMSVNIGNSDNVINQFDLNDVYRTLQPITAKYTFFSFAHGSIYQERSHSVPSNKTW